MYRYNKDVTPKRGNKDNIQNKWILEIHNYLEKK